MKTVTEKVVAILMVLFLAGMIFLANEIVGEIKSQGLKTIAEKFWYGEKGK